MACGAARSHVLDLDAITEPEDIYAAALVMLAGAAALRHYDASASGSDEVEASVLLFNGLFARFGGGLTPADVRSRMRLRCAELAAQADALVVERWCEIQGEAAQLLRAPAHLVGAPVWFRLILVALDLHRLVVARAVILPPHRGRVIEAVAIRLLAWRRASDRAMSLLTARVARGLAIARRLAFSRLHLAPQASSWPDASSGWLGDI